MDIFKRINELPNMPPNDIDDQFYLIIDKNNTGSSFKVNAKKFLQENALSKPPLERVNPNKYWVRKDGRWVELIMSEGGFGGVSQDYVDQQDSAILQSAKSYTDEQISTKLPDGDTLHYGDNLKY